MIYLFTRHQLVLIKRVSLRRRIWYKALTNLERSIIDLSIRCVTKIRSQRLAGSLKTIINKLEFLMTSRLERLTKTIGLPRAQKIAQLAFSWGNSKATKWAIEESFARYLAIMELNRR